VTGPLVVASGYIGSERGWERLGGQPPTLDQVVQRAYELGAGVVYFHDASGIPAESEVLTVTGDEGGKVWRARLAVVGERAVSVVWLEHDELGHSGPWAGLAPRELAGAFGAFERLVGVPWGDSIGHTAESLILATHPRERGGVLLDREPFIPPEIAGGTLEGPWAAWRRDLTKAEAGCAFVHSFDANAQYLGAWGTAELGHGRPVYRGAGAAKFDHREIGFWRIPKIAAVRNITPTLPAPWLEGREWFSTATVRRLLEVCDGLEAPDIAEAWVWPRKSRFLFEAASRLRDARKAAMLELDKWRAIGQLGTTDPEGALRRAVSAEVVLDAVRSLYQVETGRFGMTGRASSSPWARPDWGHTIRAMARVNLHRRLMKLRAHPFAIATDGLLFASDEPDGRRFASQIDLELGTGLGHYRYTGTAELGQVLEAGAGGRGAVRAMFGTVGA
jgi:hypothetical protein